MFSSTRFYLLCLMFPRHRKYRSPLQTYRRFGDNKFSRSIYLNTRPKPSNKSRYSYLRFNADVRRHNLKVVNYK